MEDVILMQNVPILMEALLVLVIWDILEMGLIVMVKKKNLSKPFPKKKNK